MKQFLHKLLVEVKSKITDICTSYLIGEQRDDNILQLIETLAHCQPVFETHNRKRNDT